jgi:hypothetical protein
VETFVLVEPNALQRKQRPAMPWSVYSIALRAVFESFTVCHSFYVIVEMPRPLYAKSNVPRILSDLKYKNSPFGGSWFFPKEVEWRQPETNVPVQVLSVDRFLHTFFKCFLTFSESYANLISRFTFIFLLEIMPNYRDSTCPYCPRTFRNAGPFDNHLRSSHPDRIESLYRTRPERSESPPDPLESSLLFLEAKDISYSSAPEDPSEDFDSYSSAESEFDDFSDRPEDSHETRRELFFNSAKTYGEVPGEEEGIHVLLQDPWYPFRNAIEFKLARFFVEANVSWENIENFLKASLAPPEVQFTSSFTLRTLLNSMNNSLGPETWKKAEVTLSGVNVPFFYRNPLACVEYLIRQRAYRSDMVFSPERLYEGNERQYGELHTADWWWETQVRLCITSIKFNLKGYES